MSRAHFWMTIEDMQARWPIVVCEQASERAQREERRKGGVKMFSYLLLTAVIVTLGRTEAPVDTSWVAPRWHLLCGNSEKLRLSGSVAMAGVMSGTVPAGAANFPSHSARPALAGTEKLGKWARDFDNARWSHGKRRDARSRGMPFDGRTPGSFGRFMLVNFANYASFIYRYF